MNSFSGEGYNSYRRKPRSIELLRDRSPRIKLMKYDEFVLQPVIEVTPQALEDMYTLVDLADGEVGWLGNVTNPEVGVYRIDEIFIPWQECSPTTAIFPTEGQQKLIMDLMEKGRDFSQLNFKFWGHSHVWMPCNPSQQDDSQMAQFEKFKVSYMIRGILNKRREYRFWIWDYENGFIYEDVPVTIAVIPTAERREMLEGVYKERVRELSRMQLPKLGFGRGNRTQTAQDASNESEDKVQEPQVPAVVDAQGEEPTSTAPANVVIDDSETPPREDKEVMLKGQHTAHIQPKSKDEAANAGVDKSDSDTNEAPKKKRRWFSWLWS